MNEETKEVLNVVKDMFEVLTGQMKEMKSDLQNQIKEVKNEVAEIKNEVAEIKNEVAEIKNEVAEIKNEVAEVKQRITKIETSLENETNRNIKLLVDGHIQNANKLEKLDKIEEDVEISKTDIDVIKKAITTHSSQINQLKKVK